MADYPINYTFIPTNSTYSRINETSSYSITIIILIVCCCCLIILGVGGYYSSLNNNSSTPKTIQESQQPKTTQPPTATTSQSLLQQTTQPPTATQSDKLYEFKEHKFTTAGKTGRFGPTLEEVKEAYSGVSWAQNKEFLNMTKQGIQEWKVPVTGKYKIQALGASGTSPVGPNGASLESGYGADITGIFSLSKNDVIKILVGQRGTKGKGKEDVGTRNAGGGGGGTFVVKSDNTILVVAGGGGSGFQADSAQLTTNGSGPTDWENGIYGTKLISVGGTDGNGGQTITIFNNGAWASGGGGFYTKGKYRFAAGVLNKTLGDEPESFLSGGVGGSATFNGGDGGFGGGSGSIGFGSWHGGNGGGYSGGGGGGGFVGGGGSYIELPPKDIIASKVTNMDEGSVTITLIN